MGDSIHDEDWTPSTARSDKRKWQRKPLVVAQNVKPPESPPQIAELAFNIHGWALEDVPTICGRTKFEKINAYTSTMQKGGFEQKILDLQDSDVQNIYRTDLRFTAREMDANLTYTNGSVQEYLVVGYTLQEEDPIYLQNRTFKRCSENEVVGETTPGVQNIIPWNSVRTPIYVVTPIKLNTGTSVRLFALIMPRDGLCQPVLITHERVFYRWEFRASAGKRHDQRNKNWNQIVIDKAYELMPAHARAEKNLERLTKRSRQTVTRSPSIKLEEDPMENIFVQHSPSNSFSLELDLEELFSPKVRCFGFGKNYGPSIVNTRIEIGLSSSDIRGILQQVKTSSNGRMTGELQATLRELELAQVTTSADLVGINKLLSTDSVPFTFEDAVHAANEIKQLFPRLVRLATPESVLRIKQAMVEHQLTLEFEHLEHYLTKLLIHLTIYNASPTECMDSKINEAKAEVQYLDNTAKMAVSFSRVNLDTIYVVTLLKNILMIHNWQTMAVLNQFYAAKPPLSLKQYQLVHNLNIDLEPARAEYAQAAKWLMDAARTRACDTDDITVWLMRLLNHIQGRKL